MGVHVFPILNPPSHLPPHPIPLGHPRAPAPSTLYHASNLDWQFISHIFYMFQCHSPIASCPRSLPQHPALALSHRVQKTVQYICVSFAVLHTGLLLPSLNDLMSISTNKKNRGQWCFTGLKQDLPEDFIPDFFFFLLNSGKWMTPGQLCRKL